MGLVYDPGAGRRRVTHALIFTAVYSRHLFVWLTFSQTLAAVIEGCEAAWRFFGGVFGVLVPDNASAIVADADAVNPRFTVGWLDYTQHCGFATDAARVRSPKDKPQVAYCTSLGCFVGMLCLCRSLGGVAVSLVRGRRVGPGWVVERFVLVVIALSADKTGAVPGLDGPGGHAEQRGHLGEGDQAGVAEALLAAA
jgi:hypothetical protein